MAKLRARPRSTVPSTRPPRQPIRPPAPKPVRRGTAPPPSTVARIIDSDTSLLDVLDNLLNSGVVLNAELILALANVDLIFIRLSALLCAADRLLPADGPSSPSR
jgi:gas vesicle protein GvpA/GvpJ/GvpM family